MNTHPVIIQHRLWMLVNTDPQRRCYDGHHHKSEWRWSAWAHLETVDEDRAEQRLAFWRDLNAYAVQERGQGARREFRAVWAFAHAVVGGPHHGQEVVSNAECICLPVMSPPNKSPYPAAHGAEPADPVTCAYTRRRIEIDTGSPGSVGSCGPFKVFEIYARDGLTESQILEKFRELQTR